MTVPAACRTTAPSAMPTSAHTGVSGAEAATGRRAPASPIESPPSSRSGACVTPNDTRDDRAEPAHHRRDHDRLRRDHRAAVRRDAGVRAQVHRHGEPRPLPADIDLAAFRVLQEALTNVVRHAGTGACRVTVVHGDADVTVEVVDAASESCPRATDTASRYARACGPAER
ncbi:sensor histidine kinase [Streptomyces alboniger]|uniref:sensor histidine kinase n=1 Tax=Streptomyces alboniger TaxID=132473 RepID=UPI0006E136EF|nr:ATP-binding protein [Streptomyces alboniger]